MDLETTAARLEGELVARARSGDHRAMERLLRRESPRVLEQGRRMCRDEEEAKDVLQETLLAAAQHFQGFRGAAPVSSWVRVIARSFCIKHHARGLRDPLRRAAAGGLGRWDPADPRLTPEEHLERRERVCAIEAAVAALGPAQREVLVLHDLEGRSGAEVAGALGLSLGAMKSRLHRARAQVRRRLAAEEARGPWP